MNNKTFNFGWSFYRYCALVPQKNDFDLLEWLFLNFVVYQNQLENNEINLINDEIILKVKNYIKLYFSNIIDDNLFEKIKFNIMEKYVKEKEKITKVDSAVILNLNSYDILFSDKVTMKYFYQDGITGRILPAFYSDDELNDLELKFREEPTNKLEIIDYNEPTKYQIQKAYEDFIRLSQFSSIKEEDVESYIEEENIEDDSNEQKNIKNNFNAIILKDKTEIIYCNIEINIFNNNIVCESPFGEYQNQILLDCIIKGRTLSEYVDNVLNEIDDAILKKNSDEDDEIDFKDKTDFASSLKYFSSLYRLTEHLNDLEINRKIVKLDKLFIEKDTDFFTKSGELIDRLIRKINYSESDKLYRESIRDYYYLQKELNTKYDKFNDKYIINRDVFDNWKKKYKTNNKVFNSFQADFFDILLKSGIDKTSNFYDGFITDTLTIYRFRSKTTHPEDFNKKITSDLIEKINKVVKVIIELT